MSKIIKLSIVCVLAFFILDTFVLSRPLNAQDTKTLDNGLTIIIKEDHRNPIVVFSAFINVGSASEGDYSGSGISHLVEHMLFKGTRKYSLGAIEDILHKYGGKINAFTSYDYTGFRITILKEHMNIAMDVLKEMFTAPTFDAKELKKEMRVIEKEMDLSLDDPGRRISRLTFASAYLRHPYRIPIIGYKDNFKRLKQEDVVSFFKSNYTPEKTIIAVAGDIDKKAVLNEMENLFTEIPRGKNTIIALPEEPEQLAEKHVEEKLDIEGAYLNIAFHSTGLLDKDLYASDILSFILGQGESSILNEEIRLKKELVVSISAYNYTPKYPGLFVISSVLKEESVKEALDQILKQVDLVKENGVTGEKLTKAKNNFLAGYIYEKETIESQANDLAIAKLLTGNPEFFEQYIKGIKAVTLEDIQRAAKKYLNRNNMTVVALSKSGESLKNIGAESVMQSQERSIKKTPLKNGLTVLVSENLSLPIVSISLLFKGGLMAEKKENNGISKITSLMLLDGMDTMTRMEIARFYESKGISVSVHSGNNSAGISVSCLKEYTEEAMELISNLCTNSSFPEDELKRERDELITVIDMQDNEVFNHGHRLLKKLLFKNHPYGLQTIGTRESIGKTQRKDVLKFKENLFSAENIVLGISGDCDADEIGLLAEKYFSKIPSGKPDLTPPPREGPLDKVRELIVEVEKEQSLVLIGFHGIDIYSNDRAPVEIMVEILSSEAGILYKSIRDKIGLSYATGGFEVLGMDPGYIAIYCLTSKANIGKVKDIIFKEISGLIKKGISNEELEKYKNHLKATRKMAMQTNSAFIFSASLDELYGLGYDYHKDYDKNIDGVTQEDIKRVAKKYLTLDKCAIMVLEGKDTD